jgi:O-antigen/teichoic acid export membrane protein
LKLLGIIKKSEFITNTATLLSGAVMAQVLFVLFSPLLSRLYSPAEFGMYALFTSILNPLSTIVTGKYEQAIVIPDDETDAVNIYFIVILLSLVFSILFLVTLLLFNNSICDFLNAEQLKNWLYLIPFSLFFLSFSQGSAFWFIRKKTFKASAINKISQSSLNISCSVILGFFNVSRGLIIGDVVGKFGLAVVSVFQSVKSGLNFRLVKLSFIIENLKKFKHFPLYNALPSLLVTMSISIPIFYINSFFSGSETGFVNQTRIAIFIPFSLISSALSQVLLNRFSEKRKNKLAVLPEFKLMLRNISLMGILTIIIIEAGGIALFRIVFGNEWVTSGLFSKILIFSYAIQFVVSPFSVVFIAFNRIKILSLWQFFYFTSILLLYFAKSFSITNFLIIYTSIEFFCYLIYLYLIYKVLSDYEIKIISNG